MKIHNKYLSKPMSTSSSRSNFETDFRKRETNNLINIEWMGEMLRRKNCIVANEMNINSFFQADLDLNNHSTKYN